MYEQRQSFHVEVFNANGYTQDLSADFSTPEGARKVVKLKAFSKFENTTEALAAAAALVDSKLSKGVCSLRACADTPQMHGILQQNPAWQSLVVSEVGGVLQA